MSTEINAHAESLLTLFQIVDSFFPTGAFAHAFGLETYVQEGVVNNRETLERLLRASMHGGVRGVDAIAVALAHKATEAGKIVELDRRLTAMKTPRESRQGSIRIGKQLLRNAEKLFAGETLSGYRSRIQSGECAGHHAIAYGLATKAASIPLHPSILGYLHAHVVGQVSAAVRLSPIGPTDGQLVIQALRPDLIEIATFAKGGALSDLGSFTPGLDIRSMQHERLYSRLFVS